MNDSKPLRAAVAGPVRTDHGARTELRLDSEGEGVVRYEARWFLGAEAETTPDSAATPTAHGVANVHANGEVQVEVHVGQIPEWLTSFTEKLLRTTARSAQGGRFPRRLTRWRDGPG